MNRLVLRLALWLAVLAGQVLPRQQRDWARAMQGEVAMIPAAGEALRFALGCLGHAAKARAAQHPVLLGAICACVASGLGLVFMSRAGAPPRMLAVHCAALAIGLLALANLRLAARFWPIRSDWIAAGLGLLLAVATAFGTGAQGSVRWLQLGGVLIQPSAILVPLLVLALARGMTLLSLAGLACAALTLAAQPDRAMAGALALAVLGIWQTRRERLGDWAVAIAVGGFGLAMMRADLGEAMPFVDQILWLAWKVDPVAGLAVWTGCAVLLVPAIAAWRGAGARRPGLAGQGLFWTAVILAAALDNYPTPLVGYGSSAVIGYCLSLLGLAPPRVPAGAQQRDYAARANGGGDGPLLRLALR